MRLFFRPGTLTAADAAAPLLIVRSVVTGNAPGAANGKQAATHRGAAGVSVGDGERSGTGACFSQSTDTADVASEIRCR